MSEYAPHDDLPLEATVRGIGQVLGRAIEDAGAKQGRHLGFALCVYDFGPKGFMTYMSNGRRADMVKALRELLEKIGD